MADRVRDEVAFPRLDEGQLADLADCPLTVSRTYAAGQPLHTTCERGYSFDIVKSGKVAVVDESGDEPKTLAILERGEFTGEVAQLTGGPSLVGIVAHEDCEVFVVSAEALKEILNNHPRLSDIILKAFIARREFLRDSGEFRGLRVIGSCYSRDTFRIRDFLARNRVPFTWMDLEVEPGVDELLKLFGVTEADTPVIAWRQKLMLRNPTDLELAQALGIRPKLGTAVYDLVIVGSGPAGLAAAVYGASEGLNTVVLERTGPGGQAGRSMRIENYLGFPTGITGAELTDRAVLQAQKFGARLPVPTPIIGLNFENGYSIVDVEGGETVTAKCLLIATGAEYRRLGVDGCEPMEGRGVYYAATPNEATMCRGAEVLVVGGGNSAGQAAVFLASQARKVYLLIRGDDLDRNMSSYLARRIEQTPEIEVLKTTQIQRMFGDGHLGGVEILNTATGETRTIETPAVFSFIGAVPRTDWLGSEIDRDAKGFIKTGPLLEHSPSWTANRTPFLLETSRAGVFAAGDVRSGSTKRVASAVGEGAMAVQFVHEYLKVM